ncbi:undecaprenyl-diphosphate phosphatase [Candidatus Palibaumannia cicadellinicola]|uniref:undecaprenyl-diphosphate phosphatase n=1 Tax=Candidatus Palibaumannia cicadellinicola TaxID=186490 RepID=UPI00069DDDDC|nr:undecaprenyl-diphosphate phosphatase [Candidatus Baumannia cicadellinicola]
MNDINLLFIALILGVVEGLTEFVPISSTGHMILVSQLLGFHYYNIKTFEIIIQLGPVVAVICILWRRVLGIIGLNLDKISNHNININSNKKLNINHITLGIIPSMVLGLICHKQIKNFFEPKYVISALLLGSIWLLAGQLLLNYRKNSSSVTVFIDDISYLQAFLIGCFQCFALWPGFSRSGATISGGILVGVSRTVAFEFSFILSVPIKLGATILDLYKNLPFIFLHDLPIFTIGISTSFFISFVIIKYLFKIIQCISLVPFIIYRFVLVIILYYFIY